MHLLCAVPWRPGAVHLRAPHSRPADRRGFAAPLGADLLHPHLFRQRATKGASPSSRRPSVSRSCKGSGSDADRADNRREVEAALELARKHPATIKALIVGNETLLRGELPADEIKARLKEVRGALRASGHLCRCLGVLAQGARARRRHRLRDHPYPPLLGGRSGSRAGRRRPCAGGPNKARSRVPRQGDSDRRGGLAEPGPDAARRSALAGEPGALPERRGFARQGRELEGEPDRGVRSAVEARPGGHRRRLLGPLRRCAACSRNSNSASRCRTIRIGRSRQGLALLRASRFLAAWGSAGVPPRRVETGAATSPPAASPSAPVCCSAWPQLICRWNANRERQAAGGGHARSRSGGAHGRRVCRGPRRRARGFAAPEPAALAKP